MGPNYAQGFLGADFAYDGETGGYRITHIVNGDPWEENGDSSFNKPGVNIKEDDILAAIAGQPLSRKVTPEQVLVNLARQEVDVAVRDRRTHRTRTVTVRVLGDDRALRYREWVKQNRAYVHRETKNQVGYVHIPDMMGRGYAEFHRGWLAEMSHPGLIVDVRYNSGGHVSQLILEKLARRRLGYDVSRWMTPRPYPDESFLGPIIALTNECAGSDGDIFCHCFKLMKLGKLVGKRTWGGVIGITFNSLFVDGGMTTQPEFSFWFEDVGWQVENYGTDPDVDVDYPPQAYRRGEDPQLDRTIREILADIRKNPPKLPDFGKRPRLKLPRLPKRQRTSKSPGKRK
jgi:tricorn protease